MEMGIAVISGNLPLLGPLFEHFFRHGGSTAGSKGSNHSNSLPRSRTDGLNSKTRDLSAKVDADGFERISDDGNGSPTRANSLRDIEMGDRAILVKRDFTVFEQVVTDEDLQLEKR